MENYFAPGGALQKHLPRFESRDGQKTLADKVSATLRDGGILLAEAGTGTGKTLAYLIPAIHSGRKVVVSTGTKNLQDQIANKDLPLLEEMFPGLFHAAIMKGRQNYLCKRRYATFQKQQNLFPANSPEGKLLDAIEKWAETTVTGDRSEIANLPDDSALWNEINSSSETCIGQNCPFFDDAFVTKMRQEAAMADIIIVNHHLYFADLTVRDSAFGEVIPRHDAVIFDEAHQVEEVATSYFGRAFSNFRVSEAIRDTERELALEKMGDDDTIRVLTSLGKRSQTFFSAVGGKWQGRRRLKKTEMKGIQAGATDLYQSMNMVADVLKSVAKKAENLKQVGGRFRDMADLLNEIVSFDKEDHVYWVETRGRGVFLQVSPIDVSRHLREKLYPDSGGLVFTSATLTVKDTFSYLKSRLGIDECEELIVASPFNYPQQAVFYLAEDLPEVTSDMFTIKAADRIANLLAKTDGRAFVLFTSYKNMNEVYDQLAGKIPFPVLRQGEAPRQAILESFTTQTASVLFATTSFWQGVDVPGESLSAVIIDKLPFASPGDPLVEARIEYLRKTGGNPFRDFQLPAAALTLKQGLGRLIRSTSDTGLLAVLDRRLKTKSYGKTFRASLPMMEMITDTDELDKRLARLWRS